VPAVLCNKCAIDLPEGAEFCLKCGEPVRSAAAVSSALTAVLGCSKCGTALPEGAQFCPKCGKSVSIPRNAAQPKNSSAEETTLPRDSAPIEPIPARTPRAAKGIILALVVILLLFVAAWVTTSDNPFAQGVQQMIGLQHDQAILDAPFTVGPHNFRYYKFVLPQGSINVSVVGQFTATSENHNGKTDSKDPDNHIQVLLLNESAFTVWQNGYATSSVYETGKVSQATIQTDLPAGAGVYYMVFSNKFAPKTEKRVNATVLLRYKNWIPRSFQELSERFWNWLGV
jgi:ribosomal protein L40E